MGLFFDVLSAINNPNQQGSVNQLESITNSIQQLATNRGIQPSQIQSAMSVLGNILRPTLQKQQSALGGAQLQNLINQAVTTSASASGQQSLLSPQLQQQIVQAVSQKTGLSPNMIQAALPSLISAVLGFLNMGATIPGIQASNPILNTFLDSDRDGDTDLGDVLRFANRFINPPATS
ncbi:DUF937 domain-containing protein [Chlorogloeopsis sp. ULAP02]|uniref:DUF937 domain-containing protein n=1 Tax=Chlorogloeopsis sp. ULAP02 TaxID=3107926 RepID=UPI003135F74D